MQGEPPVGAVEMAKSPVMAGAVRVMGVALEVRLVRVKSVGALALWTGTVPRSWVRGVRTRPVGGRPVPVRLRV